MTKKEKRGQIKKRKLDGTFELFGRHKRHAKRRAEQGRENERRVLDVLTRAQQVGRYHEVRMTVPSSAEDRGGKDFVVTKEVAGALLERAFGVTISLESQKKTRLRYPNISCFVITPEMKDETLLAKIDALFRV